MKLSVEWPTVDDGFAGRLIASVVRRLYCSLRIAGYEQDDIEQHLTTELWLQRDRFDASRGAWEAFVTNIVRTAAIKMLRHARAAKRDDRQNVSLSSVGIVADTVAEHDLRIDLATAIKRLSRGQRIFLAAIGRGPRDEVRAKLGISRRKFDSRKKLLARALQAMDMDEYCC